MDANEAFRHAATDLLRRHRELIVVGAICGGEEALAQAQDLQPQVILIGRDRSGLETISRLRKALPGVGIIALTLLNGTDYRQAALAAGADGPVPKAELVTDLLPAIRWATQADSAVSDAAIGVVSTPAGGSAWSTDTLFLHGGRTEAGFLRGAQVAHRV